MQNMKIRLNEEKRERILDRDKNFCPGETRKRNEEDANRSIPQYFTPMQDPDTRVAPVNYVTTLPVFPWAGGWRDRKSVV